jgi:hypothetical protein
MEVTKMEVKTTTAATEYADRFFPVTRFSSLVIVAPESPGQSTLLAVHDANNPGFPVLLSDYQAKTVAITGRHESNGVGNADLFVCHFGRSETHDINMIIPGSL